MRFHFKRDGYDSALVIRSDNGEFLEFEIDYHELKQLALMSAVALDELEREMQADYEDECKSLNDAEDEAIRQRETALELEFSRNGYDDIPF